MIYRKKNRDQNLERALERLKREALKNEGLEKSFLSKKEKQFLHDVLLKRISRNNAEEDVDMLPSSLSRLVRAIREKAKEVTMPKGALVTVKERILDYVETPGTRRFSVSNFVWARLRTSFAAALLFFFVVSAVVISPWQTSVTQARATFVDDVQGDVVVVRNMNRISPQKGMLLREGDEIFTLDGTLTIQFFEDSLSRLDTHTSVEIRRLATAPSSSVLTNVELYVDKGRVWSKVINLFDDSEFLVDTLSLAATVDKKAVFDLSASNGKTEVAVFDSVVDVTVKKAALQQKKAVLAGYKAQVESDGSAMKLEKISQDMLAQESVWFAENLEKDEQYEATLIADKADLQQSEPVILASEVALEALENPEAESARKAFLDSYSMLLAAEKQLTDGEAARGIQGLVAFQSQVDDILLSLANLRGEDALYADAVRNIMKEKIALQVKDFSSFNPGNPLYNAKKMLQEVELRLAMDSLDFAATQLRQAGNILLEMEDAAGDNDVYQASFLLAQYRQRINAFVPDFLDENSDEFDKRFVKLLRRQADQLKLLTAIEQSIVEEAQFLFRDELRAVRADMLRKFVIALQHSPQVVPHDIILEVKDLYNNYITGESIEGDLAQPAFEKLLENEYQLLFISPDGSVMVGTEFEILLLQDATPEVHEEVPGEHSF